MSKVPDELRRKGKSRRAQLLHRKAQIHSVPLLSSGFAKESKDATPVLVLPVQGIFDVNNTFVCPRCGLICIAEPNILTRYCRHCRIEMSKTNKFKGDHDEY